MEFCTLYAAAGMPPLGTKKCALAMLPATGDDA